jgi:toluene monooxygenase electron transfer component
LRQIGYAGPSIIDQYLGGGGAMQIQLSAKNRLFSFDVPDGESILYAGMRQGLELPYGCATGTCGTCKVRCHRGRCVSTWPDAPGMRVSGNDSDALLMCQSTPLEDTVLETGATVYRADPGSCLPNYAGGWITEERVLAPDVMAFSLELDRPMSHEAGQFVALRVPVIPGYRVYSMTNFSPGSRRLDLLIKRKPGGGFSEWLFNPSRSGIRVNVFGPLGRATFSPSAGRHLLIIAGGSGIAGMMSILARAMQEGYFDRYRGHVFFGVRTWSDRFFLAELAEMQAAHPGQLSVTLALSDEDLPESAASEYPGLAFARGLVHEVAVAAMAGNCANTRAYVAGPPVAVNATLRSLLRDAKLAAADIRYDKFG